MEKAISLAKKIMHSPSDNYKSHLEDINLHKQFLPLFKLGYSDTIANTLIAFIIFAYDNDSSWLDVRKDRKINKQEILAGLNIEIGDKGYKAIFDPILNYENDEVQEVILHYLMSIMNAKWQEIHSLLDYSTKMILFVNRKTDDKKKIGTEKVEENVEDIYQDYDIKTISAVNKEKGDLLLKAIESRKKAEELLEQLHKDYVKTDTATQADFGFTYSDTPKYDEMSWKQFITRGKDKKNSKTTR